MQNPVNPDNQSLDSILQLLSQQAANGASISPYLSAIQSLGGTKPGEKYKELNLIVKRLVASNIQAQQIPTKVPPAIEPLVQILVAKELKSFEVVLEALKSEDKTISSKALRTKWFFNASNSHVEVDYFMTNLLPYVSELVRFKIIKNLSRSLHNAPKKAEDFFTKLSETYGIKEAMPLLNSCSDDFIFDEILKQKLHFSSKKLLSLYKIRPKVVLRFLQLGNVKNKNNEEERKIHTIHLYNYQKFLPHLIRHNVQDFIELYDQYANKKLGSTLSALLLKNATDEIIQNPEPYLKLVTLKAVCKKLTLEQIERMYANLFPKDYQNFNFGNMLRYLKYYPKVKRLDLMKRLYKEKYSMDLLSNVHKLNSTDLDLVYNMISPQTFEELFIKAFPKDCNQFSVDIMLEYLHLFPQERKLMLLMEKFKSFYNKDLLDDIKRIESEPLLKLLPSDLRVVQAKRLVDLYIKDNECAYYKWCSYLPPNESFEILKEVIAKTSTETMRRDYIKYMLLSCSVYDSQKDLLNVLRYYNTRHRNEKVEILTEILIYINEIIDLTALEKSHIQIFFEIMQRAYTKNELFKLSSKSIGPFFDAIVHHLLVQCNHNVENMMLEDKIFLDKIFDMAVDYNLESIYDKWIFLPTYPSVMKYCFDKLLNIATVKYPKEHSIWRSKNHSDLNTKVLSNILDAFIIYNNNIQKFNKKTKEKTEHIEQLCVNDYPWLIESIKELSKSRSKDYYRMIEIKQNLRKLNPELLRFLIDKKEEYSGENVKSGAAWIKLKKNQDEVLAHWTEYLNVCRQKLQFNTKNGAAAARRFLLSTLWCKDLPIRFVERCLLEIKESGSIKVLGILLEAESFSKLAAHFIPKNSSVDSLNHNSRDYFTIVQSILPAMNFTNPPVPFDVITHFCQGDYTKLAIQVFTCTSKRVSRIKILEFSRSLVKKPVSVKKHGIRMIFQVASVNELREFFKEMWPLEKHVSIREIYAQIIATKLQQSPNDKIWELMTICIDGLKVEDEVPLLVLCNTVASLNNEYFTNYLKRLLNKIDELDKNGLPQDTANKLISTVFCNVQKKQIRYFTEDMIMEYLEKYFFNANSKNVHSALQQFSNFVFGHDYKYHQKI